MSTSFATSQRRKPIATYGKKSRNPNLVFHEDNSSPERTRHQASNWGGTLKNSSINTELDIALANGSSLRKSTAPVRSSHGISSNVRATSERLLARPTSAKDAKNVDLFDVPSSDEEHLPLKKATPTPNPFRRTEAAKPPIPTRTIIQPKSPARAVQTGTSIVNPLKNKASDSKLAAGNGPSKKVKIISDVFDVPSSGEEDAIPARIPRRLSPTKATYERASPASRRSSTIPSPRHNIESDSSTASAKRKRDVQSDASLGIHSSNNRPVQFRSTITVVPQRNKMPRNLDNNISADRNKTNSEVSMPKPQKTRPPEVKDTAKKPTRNQARTILIRSPIAKGRSAPAKLQDMLPGHGAKPAQYPSPLPSVSASPVEDTTMYDIPGPTTPPQSMDQRVSASISRTVTPRQKQIWDNLLGEPPETTTPSTLNIGKLALSEGNPTGNSMSLVRSSSDIPRTSYLRRPRLIDNLVRNALPEEEDEESSEGDTDIDVALPPVSTPKTVSTYGRGSRLTSASQTEVTELDVVPESNSQSSQIATFANGGPKITYAKQRSYLEESSLESDLLFSMPMEVDSPAAAGSRRRILGAQTSTRKAIVMENDEMDDSINKVRSIHELRRKGQNSRFEFETHALLDDIADKGGNKSRRRSAMMELTTKLMEDSFIGQLFDTGLDRLLLKSLTSNGEPIFDFASIVAVAFILKTDPSVDVLDQIYRSGVFATLTTSLEQDTDVSRIAKERRTNMSKIGQEDVAKLGNIVRESSLWSIDQPQNISPQVVALRCLELLVLGLRKAGNAENLLGDKEVVKLVRIASVPCEHVHSGSASASNLITLNLVFSTLEAASTLKDRNAPWSQQLVQQLVGMISVLLAVEAKGPIKLAIRLCMNLTNNNPKVCEVFSGPSFIKPLVQSISYRFDMFSGDLVDEERMEVLETVILSMGAMINLAEFSDNARLSVIAGDNGLLESLVKTFLEGLERAAQADSMEESQSSVATGYLTVLLGNLCLNDQVRFEVRKRLPGKKMDVLISAVQEFIYYNEKVDRDVKTAFDGDEGQETWANFTQRLQAVVDRLKRAEADA